MQTENPSPGVPRPKTSRLALASLALGILSLLTCVLGILFAIPGLICGFMGMNRVKKSGGSEGGHGVALAGTILSGIAIVLFPILLLLTAIAVPNFIKARDASIRNACVSNLKALDQAKAVWALENRKPAGEIPADSDLFTATGLLRAMPVCPAGGKYSINPVGTKPTCSIPNHQF